MRAGEQQPGGEPNSPWSNPYQQPGYQQQNPYQGATPTGQQQWGTQPGQPQPGQWQQPGPLGPPTDGQGVPAPDVPPPGGSSGGRKGKTMAIAIVSATAVLAAAVITGVVVLSGDDDGGDAGAGGDSSPSPSEEPTAEEEGPDLGPDDPRQGIAQIPDPVVAPDWQVQTLENRHIAFDVPAEDWTIGSEGMYVGYEDPEAEEPADDEEWAPPELYVSMAGAAIFMDGWCPESETGASWRATAGTKGAQGATGTEEAAYNEAGAWAWAAYDPDREGTIEVTDAVPFESDHGIVGHTATATVTGVPEDPDEPCGSPGGGKVITVSYQDLSNDMATWVLVMDTGYEGEPSQETIDQILSSLRPFPVEE
ncbi:hypothetical protein [Streptomyces radicis]|nr:hypothetical protein [Streptomyces radicis]